MLLDLTLNFPIGELSLVCGKLGSGKTLLLLGKSAPSLLLNSPVPITTFDCLYLILVCWGILTYERLLGFRFKLYSERRIS